MVFLVLLLMLRAKTGILVIDKLEEISTNSKERHSTSSKALQEIIINLIDEGVFTINTIDNENIVLVRIDYL